MTSWRESAAPESSPPWLFAWMLLFFASLPVLFGVVKETIVATQRVLDDGRFFGSQLAPWLVVPALQEVAVYVPLFAGTVAVFFPRLRGRYLEKRYRLAEQSAEPASLIDVRRFVTAHAPWIRVTSNVARTDILAFVYPSGFRRANLAVFGALLTLWRRDREAAEAVLVHEIAHCRRGDHLLIGAGSFLEWALRRWWLISLALVTVPLLVVWIESLAMIASADAILPALVERSIVFWAVAVPRLLPPMLLTVVLWPAMAFSVPILCIWAAELAADRTADGNPAALLRALPAHERGTGTWHLILQRISHPPLSLRRWFLGRSGSFAVVVLLLVFPAAYLVRFLFQTVWAISTTLTMQQGTATLASKLLGWFQSFSMAAVWPLALAAVISACWPALANRWQRLLTGSSPTGRLPRREFTLTGAILLILALLPHLATASCGRAQSAEGAGRITLDKAEYEVGEEIVVRYSSLPGNAQDWLSIVPHGAPEDEWGIWTYTGGETEGVWRTEGLPVGRYEARLYLDWPAGGFEIQDRAELTVRVADSR